jgi:acyl-CoA thioester hydrolase
MREHRIELDVRVSDTDLVGTVANGRYFDWFTTGRLELYRQAGVLDIINGRPRLLGSEDYVVVIARTEATFHAPIHFGDRLTLVTAVNELKRKSIVFEHTLWKDDTLVAKASAVHVCVASKTLQAAELPVEVTERLSAS